jgi:hypothetical protein
MFTLDQAMTHMFHQILTLVIFARDDIFFVLVTYRVDWKKLDIQGRGSSRPEMGIQEVTRTRSSHALL